MHAARFLPLGLFLVACGAVADEPASPAPPVVDSPAPPPATTTTSTPTPATTTPPATTCVALEENVARDGVPSVIAAHDKSCTFNDYDGVGVVMRILRTADAGKKHFVTEDMDRLDNPARDTEHDMVFGVAPRKTRATFEYDAAGRLTKEATDNDGNGSVDTTRWSTFDTAGNETTSGLTWTFDGAPTTTETSTTTRTFDANGLVLVESTNRTAEKTRVSTFTRRADGQPLTHEDRNGTDVESSAIWTYDANDTSTKRETSAIRTTTTIVNKKGRTLEEREDQPKDGVDDYIHQYTYDATGNIIVHDRAFGKNGEPYGELKATLDAQGRVIETWKQWGFGQTKGPTTDVEKITYDACSQVVSIQRTQNGAPHSSVKRTYDSRGYMIIEEQERFLPTKMMPNRVSRSFDAQGRVTEILEEDLDSKTNKWSSSKRELKAYDSLGHLIEAMTITPTAAPQKEAWTYDANGDLVLHERSPSSPTTIIREEMSYACLY